MRLWAGTIIALFAGCGSSPKSEPPPTPEQVAYARATTDRTPEACRDYQRRFPRGAHRRAITALYEQLRRDSFKTASQADTPEAYDEHIRRFPESKAQVRREQRKRAIAQEHAARNRAKYEAVLAARTVEACRDYLAQPDQDFRSEVQAILAELADQGFALACEQDTPETYTAHLKRFPEDRKRVVAHRRELRDKRLEVVRRAKTVRFVIEYTERDEPAQFPRELRAAMRDLVGYANLRIVDDESAEIVVTVAGNGYTTERKYSRGYVVVNAYSKFSGELIVRHRNGFEDRSALKGSFTSTTDMMMVSKRGARRRPGSAKPSEAIHHARVLAPLVRFVLLAFGPIPVAKALAHPSDSLNEAAAFALRTAKPRPNETLVAAVRPYLAHENIQVRRRAVHTLELGWRPGPDAPEAERLGFYLFMRWRGWGKQVSPVPLRGLTRASVPIARAVLAERDYELGLGSIKPQRRRDEDLRERSLPQERAAMLLASLGDTEGLIAELKRPYPAIAVCWALARVGQPATPALIALLDDPSSPGREEAYWALGLLGVREILDRLEQEPASLGRTKTRVRDQLELPALLDALKSAELGKREAAARLLIGVRDPRVLQPLLSALKDEDATVRGHALLALGILADKRALPTLCVVPHANRTDRLKWAIMRIEAYSAE